MSYFCVGCASHRFTTEWPRGNVLSEQVEKSRFTAWIKNEYPGPCNHQWFFMSGSWEGKG